MEQLVQISTVAILAAALMDGKDLIVPLTQMTVRHRMAVPSAFMVEAALIEWGDSTACACQTIQVSCDDLYN